LKTHAHGWRYVMTPDGVLVVTTPTGVTRVSRPPGMGPDDDPVLRVSSEPVRPGPAPVLSCSQVAAFRSCHCRTQARP
jgi:hypothetical protein